MSVDLSPSVTVLMAVYNGEKYLREAVDSVLSQDFDEFEFLIVDDASTDKTLDILALFYDRRIKLIRNSKNIGLTKSLNRGLQEARGKYIARLDADDRCLAGRLSRQVDFLNNNSSVWVVGSDSGIINESGDIIQIRKAPKFHGAIVVRLMFSNSIVHSSVMFRKEQIIGIGGYDSSFQRAQDYDLWLRVASSEGRLAVFKEIGAEHRVHHDRVTYKDSDVMEQCRVRALQQGMKLIFGLRVKSTVLRKIQLLRLRCVKPGLITKIKIFLFFRQLNGVIASKYSSEEGAIEELEKNIFPLLTYLIKDSYVLHKVIYPYIFQKGVCSWQVGLGRYFLRNAKKMLKKHIK